MVLGGFDVGQLKKKKKTGKERKATKRREFRGIICDIYSIHKKLSHKMKKKHINSIILKHPTIELGPSIKIV